MTIIDILSDYEVFAIGFAIISFIVVVNSILSCIILPFVLNRLHQWLKDPYITVSIYNANQVNMVNGSRSSSNGGGT